MDPVLAAVLAVLLMSGVGAWLVIDGKARRAATSSLRATLEGTDLSLKERDDAAAAGLTVSPFGLGTRRTATEVLSSEDGRVKAFTYRWNSSSSKKAEQSRRVVTVATGLRMPAVLFEADAAISGLKASSVGASPDMQQAAFNATWTVHAADDAVAASLASPVLIARLLKDDLYGRTVFFESGVVGVIDYPIDDAKLADHANLARKALSELASQVPESLRRQFS